MTKPDAEVETVALARRMSLVKWKRVRKFARELINEIDAKCGFCELGIYRAREKELRFIRKCDHCGVEKRCQKILSDAGKIEDKLDSLIDGTIDFLELMERMEKEE